MKSYIKLQNLIMSSDFSDSNTNAILKILNKLPDSEITYGMDYYKLKKSYELSDNKEEILTIPELICLAKKTQLLKFYIDKNYDLTEVKQRNGMFLFVRNNREDSIFFPEGQHSILSCLLTYNSQEAEILNKDFNINLFKNHDSLKLAYLSSTLFTKKEVFLNLCINNEDYLEFLNDNTFEIFYHLKNIYEAHRLQSNKVNDTGFIMLETLNSTSFLEKAENDDVMLVLKIFLALDKFNDFIYFSKIKSKFEQRFGYEEVNAQIFNTMININNISTNIHLLKSGCSLINWKQNTKYINTQQEKEVFSTVLSNFFNNNDIKNFDWFLSNTTLFKELKLLNFIMKFNFNFNSTKNSFLFSCLTNQHLKHSREELNDDMKEKLDKLLRYNSLKERNIIKSHTLNFEEESNHINIKRL